MHPMALRVLGTLLFVTGLTYAAWFAAWLPTDGSAHEGMARVTAWIDAVGTRFFGGVLFVIVGGLLARRANKMERKPEKAEAGASEATYQEAFADVVASVDGLDASALPGSAKELSESFDALLNDKVPQFLGFRTTIIDELGLERFAEMIGHFASMERAAARAWSVLTDEAWAEVAPSVKRAKAAAARADKALSA